jgi:hypothetical protein
MSWAAPRSSFLLPCWFTRYSRRFATAENDRTCEVHGAVLSVLKAPVLIRWGRCPNLSATNEWPATFSPNPRATSRFEAGELQNESGSFRCDFLLGFLATARRGCRIAAHSLTAP